MISERLAVLLDKGLLERAGRGRYILSGRLYGFLGEKGTYTRKRGLDRETNKSLLLKHIKDNEETGTPLHELMQVLPGHTRAQVKTLVQELKDEGRAYPVGERRWAKWFPGLQEPKP